MSREVGEPGWKIAEREINFTYFRGELKKLQEKCFHKFFRMFGHEKSKFIFYEVAEFEIMNVCYIQSSVRNKCGQIWFRNHFILPREIYELLRTNLCVKKRFMKYCDFF